VKIVRQLVPLSSRAFIYGSTDYKSTINTLDALASMLIVPLGVIDDIRILTKEGQYFFVSYSRHPDTSLC